MKRPDLLLSNCALCLDLYGMSFLLYDVWCTLLSIKLLRKIFIHIELNVDLNDRSVRLLEALDCVIYCQLFIFHLLLLCVLTVALSRDFT